MKTSKAGVDFIKGFESFVPYVYDDLVPPVRGKYKEWDGGTVEGTLTIGYGHTDAAKHPLKIKQGLRIDEAEAAEILAVDLADCEACVAKALKKPVTQGQFDACSSFTFNCGPGNLENIARRINRGDYDGARAAFDLYVKSKGIKLIGLQRRRDGEQALWDMVPPAKISAEDTFHPAEVDAPVVAPKIGPVSGSTAKDLVKAGSRTLIWIQWMKKLFIGGGAGTLGLMSSSNALSSLQWVKQMLFGDWDALGILSPDKIASTKGYIDALKTLLADHAGLLVLAGIVAGIFVAHAAQYFLVLAANEGRYAPQGSI